METTFAKPDHSLFGSASAKLIYARLPSGLYIHVSEVSSGLLKDGVCPVCRLAVVARKGEIVSPHFAHYSGGKPCTLSTETRAHIWAKEVIERQKRIVLPEVATEFGGSKVIKHKADEWTFDTVKLEERVGNVIPDVILTKDGKDVFLEVRVTHKVDKSKREKLISDNRPTFEVDLSQYRRSKNDDEIAKALLTTAPRHWVHNSKLLELEKQVRADFEAKEARRTEAIEARAREIIRYKATITTNIPAALKQEMRWVSDFGLEKYLIPDLPMGEGFQYSAPVWQAALLSRLFITTNNSWHMYRGFSFIEASRKIQDCITDPYRTGTRREVIKAAKAIDPDFKFPFEVIRIYCGNLVRLEFLDTYGGGTYFVREDAQRQISDRKNETAERQRRKIEGRSRIEKIINEIPADERQNFVLSKWFSSPIAGIGRKYDDIASEGGNDWVTFSYQLSDIERMLRGGEPPKTLLALPLDKCAKRIQEKREQDRLASELRQKEFEARMSLEREAVIIRKAAELLGSLEGNLWIGTVGRGEKSSYLDKARLSQEGLEGAYNALYNEYTLRMREAKKEDETASLRAQLTKEANKSLDEQRAHLFLHTQNPKINSRPWNYCVSQQALQTCLSLLREIKQTRR